MYIKQNFCRVGNDDYAYDICVRRYSNRPYITRTVMPFIKRAQAAIYRHYNELVYAGEFSFEEAVQKMPKDTAAGYPWKGTKGDVMMNQLALLKENVSNLLSEDCERYLKELIWKVCHKDEVLKLSKRIYSERTIVVCPIDYYLACIILFGKQAYCLHEHWFETDVNICIGMSRYRGDFLAIMRYFDGCAWIHAGDVSGMEFSIHKDLVYIVGELRCLWSSSEHKHLIPVFYNFMAQAKILLQDGAVLQTENCIKSGHPLTCDDNSLIVNLLVLAYWLSLGYDVKDFWTTVALKVVGDDLLVGCRENNDFTYEGLQAFFLECSLVLKDEGVKYGSAYGLEFLSNIMPTETSYISSTRPSKIVARLYFYGETLEEQALILESLWNELCFEQEYAPVLRHYAEWLTSKGAKVRLNSEVALVALYRGVVSEPL
jgi:hypothetical protein